MACYESEVKDKLKVNPLVAKAFWNEAKAHFDTGKDFEGTVKSMAEKSGLQEATVARILTADKRLKAITRDMWLKRAKYREITQGAQRLVEQADTPAWAKNATAVWDLTRRAATIGHGGVFPFTHARNLLFRGEAEAKIFKDAVKDAYSYLDFPKKLGGKGGGTAKWSEDMANMQLDPEYRTALQMGVDIHPSSEPVGILAAGVKGWGRRGFDALKPARLKLWKEWSSKLPDDMRDEASGRMLAREINYATGSIGKTSNQFARVTTPVMFAPKLWFAKRMEAYQPLRYLVNAGKMTPGQRMVANNALKSWGKVVAVSGGLLAANDALNKYVLKNNHRVNFTDFSKPGTLWRMNIGGTIVPLSPMVETLRTPVAFVAALMARKRDLRGEAPLTSAGRLVLKDFLNALHPSITAGVEFISGREAFGVPGQLRRLPFPGVAQMVRGEEPEKVPPMSGFEYLAEKGPIPLSAGVREFVQIIKDQGASDEQANAWVKSLIQSALSGGAGVHTFEEQPPTIKVNRVRGKPRQ